MHLTKELYNLRHARVRVAAEQAFGLLKRVWIIVRIVPFEYDMERQIQIVYAVTALYNFMIAQKQKIELTDSEKRQMRLAAARASR